MKPYRINGHAVNPPCHGCKDRYTNCHDTCLKFRQWRDFADAENELRRKNKQAEREISDVLYGKKRYIRTSIKE